MSRFWSSELSGSARDTQLGSQGQQETLNQEGCVGCEVSIIDSCSWLCNVVYRGVKSIMLVGGIRARTAVVSSPSLTQWFCEKVPCFAWRRTPRRLTRRRRRLVLRGWIDEERCVVWHRLLESMPYLDPARGACGLWFAYAILLCSSLRWLHCTLPTVLWAMARPQHQFIEEATRQRHPLLAEALPRATAACCPPVWVRRDVEGQLVLASYPPR
jgi:hypothetical protein